MNDENGYFKDEELEAQIKPGKKQKSEWGFITPKQKKFVQEYLIDFNATRAYKAAGYGIQGKLKQPKSSASQLLNNPRVQAYIKHEQEERARRVHVDQDRVVRELAKIAFTNPKRLMTWDANGVEVKPSREISDDDASTIQEVSVTYNQFGANVRVVQHSKTRALELLGQHLGMFNQKDKSREITDPMEEAKKIVELVQEMEATMNPPKPEASSVK